MQKQKINKRIEGLSKTTLKHAKDNKHTILMFNAGRHKPLAAFLDHLGVSESTFPVAESHNQLSAHTMLRKQKYISELILLKNDS